LDFSKYLRLKYILTFSSLNYLQAGISFLVSIFLARELGKEDFGYFSYGMIFANTISTLMQFGTDQTLVRDLVQLNKPSLVISSAAWIWFGMGSLIVAGVTCWAFFFSGLGYSTSLIVVLCSFLGFTRGMTPAPWFDFKGKANYQSLIILADRLFFLVSAVIIIFYIRNEKVIINVALAQLVCRIATLLAEWLYVVKTATLIKAPVYSFIKKLMKSNSWVWFAAIGNLLASQVNQLILDHKFGKEELALYGFAFQVMMVIRLLQLQVLRLLTPSIAAITKSQAANPVKIKKALFKFCLTTLLLSLCIILPAYFIAPYLIGNFINKDFLAALPVLNIFYLWAMVFGVAIIINQFLIGFQLQRFYFICTTTFGLISLLLAWIFIDKYKAPGAALSVLVTHICSVVFQLFIVLRHIKKQQHDQKSL